MLPLYLQNQSRINQNTFYLFSLILIALDFIDQTTMAEESFSPQNKPLITQEINKNKVEFKSGLYSEFKSIIDNEKRYYRDILIKRNISLEKDLTQYAPNSIKINQRFLSQIILFTPHNYFTLGLNDECTLIDLYLSGLLKSAGKNLDYFILDVIQSNDKNKTVLVKSELFLQQVAQKRCPQSFKLKENFKAKNLKKTLLNFKLEIPKTLSQCYSIHQKLSEDVKVPYYCSLVNQIKSITNLEKKLSKISSRDYLEIKQTKLKLRNARKKQRLVQGDAYHYLDNFCQNISHQKYFCNKFFQSNGWKKIFSKELNPLFAVPTCMSEISSNQRKQKTSLACSKKIGENPTTCLQANPDINSSFPRPNCQQLQYAINHSKLSFNKLDCPNKIGNNSMTTINRFLNHFKKYQVDSKIQIKSPSHRDLIDQCSTNSVDSFARFNLTVPQSEAWKNHLCFINKIENKEECFPTLFGSSPDYSLSIQNNVNKILVKSKAKDPKTQCTSVLKKNYNPQLLKYKTGCHIVIDNSCKINNCSFEVYYNGLVMRHIKAKYGNKFQLFPHTYRDQKLSQISLINEETNLKSRRIKNLFEYKFHLKNHPNTLVIGVGCREDLLPANFKRIAFNQCTPESFLIDNYLEKDETVSFITFLSIDDITTPRIISWRNLYRSVRAIQKFSPLMDWNLIAFYEK